MSEDIAEVFLGRRNRFHEYEPLPDQYIWGCEYACAVRYKGQVIFNHDRSSTKDAIKDSALDVYGRMRWHKCGPQYILRTGHRINEGGEVVQCGPVSLAMVEFFTETLDALLKKQENKK